MIQIHSTLLLMRAKTTPKNVKRVKQNLDENYSYLGGNAFGRDSKGRIKKDDQAMSNDIQTAGHLGDQEYSAYVYYDFEIV
jgi:V-type H+-transporting ATPase subunit C